MIILCVNYYISQQYRRIYNYLGLKVINDPGQPMDSPLNGVSSLGCGLWYPLVCE